VKLVSAVRRSLRGLDLAAADKGTAELALTYAKQIDDGGDVKVFGPLLLAVLESLLMTPRARAAVLRGVARDGDTLSPLDELRARRAARVDDPETVDPAPP
jgi:hypothetical protein